MIPSRDEHEIGVTPIAPQRSGVICDNITLTANHRNLPLPRRRLLLPILLPFAFPLAAYAQPGTDISTRAEAQPVSPDRSHGIAAPSGASAPERNGGNSPPAGRIPDAASAKTPGAAFPSASAASGEIIVTAPHGGTIELLAGTSVLAGEALVRALRGQLGDTLAGLPGVSSTSFAPGASRPVLRGFSGPRVRVLTDGLGALDASSTSSDHAVSLDPLTAERIEVLRGPAALLYGSEAIGGAVNVVDRRIPRRVPEEGVHVDAIGSLGSAADERRGGGAIDLALGDRIVLHANGSYLESDDLSVGGYVLSPSLRQEQLEIAANELEAKELEKGHLEEAGEAQERAMLRGSVPNSAARQYSLAGGMALINEGGSLGFSVGLFDSRYGVPMRPGGREEDGGERGGGGERGNEHGQAHEPVSIDLRQWRADLRGEVALGGGAFETLRVRAGHADYRHTEFEGDEIGTVFRSQGFETRIELVQADRGGWRGASGVQGVLIDFDAIGAEAFVPAYRNEQLGLFTLQQIDLGAWGLEFAGRVERASLTTEGLRAGLDPETAADRVRRSFTALSGAVGVSREVTRGLTAGINLSRAERAPSAEELFSNGAHAATQSYELGDPDFSTEKALGLEGWVRGRIGPLRVNIAAYAQRFDDFIYLKGSEQTLDGLPLRFYAQADARWFGLEGELSAALHAREGLAVDGELLIDYVHARISDGGGPVPRIPPLRIRPALAASTGPFGARVEVEHVFAQKALAAFETPTEDFTLVNASLSWRPFGTGSETAVVLALNNAFDVDARRHASVTRDFVPLPGRDARLSVHVAF